MIEIKFDKNSNKSIAYDNNVKIGECEFVELEECWAITHTEVSYLYRGQGIAKRLVECIIENSKNIIKISLQNVLMQKNNRRQMKNNHV